MRHPGSAQPQSLSEGKLRPGLGRACTAGGRSAQDPGLQQQTLICQLRILSGSLLPRHGPRPPAAPGHWAWASFSAWEVGVNDPSLQGSRASMLPGAEQVASENVSYHPCPDSGSLKPSVTCPQTLSLQAGH